MSEEQQIKEQPHSVKFSVNAKLQWSGECKVYADNPDDALSKATSIAKSVEKIIKGKNGL